MVLVLLSSTSFALDLGFRNCVKTFDSINIPLKLARDCCSKNWVKENDQNIKNCFDYVLPKGKTAHKKEVFLSCLEPAFLKTIQNDLQKQSDEKTVITLKEAHEFIDKLNILSDIENEYPEISALDYGDTQAL